MAAPMSDEELYQLTGSWEAAAALRDEQARGATQNTQTATANVAAPSANFTLDDLKALYKQKGATEKRYTDTEQGRTEDYIPIQYGNGWSAFENDNRKIIDYIGSGMDATPVYDDAPKTLGGFSKQEGDYVYNYDPEGKFLGRTKWNESDLKRIIKDLGPLAMAAVTMGGGGAFLGNSLFGLTGSAASAAGGALAGGINAYGNDQDILKGALLGGVSGAGTAKLSDILGADALGGTFKNATVGDVSKVINFAKDPTLAGAANLASPYMDTNIKLGDTGFTTNDVLRGLNTVQALGSGNDKKIFDALTGLAKTYGSSGGASSGVDQSTVGNFDDNEVTRLKNLGYNNDQIKAYFGRLENLTGIFDEEDEVIPVDLGSKSLSSVGSDQTASNVVGANDTVNVTSNRSNDALLDFLSLNNPVGNISKNYTDDLNELVITGNKNGISLDDFLSLNTPVGNITNNYTDDLNELVITGNKNGTSLNDFLTLNDIVGDTTNNYVDDTVLVTGKTDKTNTTDTTGTTKDDGIEELVVTGKKECAPGFHDDGTGLCVADDDDVKEDGCPEGYILDLATNQCVKLDDTKVTVPPKKVVTPKVDTKKKTTDDMMDSLGLGRQAPSQDPYANIKSMEDLFGGDIAYKLRALGVNPSQKTASSDMDELVRLLRG
jgi:hypothetical protein